MTRVICAFAGTGKSYFHRNSDSKTLDLSSGRFARIREGVRHPDFPNNYVKHIKAIIDEGEQDYVFVSCQKEVCDALSREDIDYTLVFPHRSLKSQYLNRYIQRGSPEAFINLLSKNWNDWILESEKIKCRKIILQEGQYLSDIL